MKLEGRVAIVTGGARGIGRSVSLIFAREGAKVALFDVVLERALKTVNEIKALGREAVAFKVDVSKKDEIKKAVERVIDTFHKVDILVNNAGIFSSVRIEEMTEEEWDKVMAVNLKGSFFCSQAVVRWYKHQKYGKIINIGSIAGQTGGLYAGVHYSASKAGVVCLTKSLAKRLAKYNISVNGVNPGLVETDMTRDWPKDVKGLLKKQIPLGRLGQPEDVAKVVLFLASDDSNYITGETINVDGGSAM